LLPAGAVARIHRTGLAKGRSRRRQEEILGLSLMLPGCESTGGDG
jgi:hypothetical protein